MKPSKGCLSAVELECATLLLVKFVQRECFSEELERLQKLSNFEEIGRVSCKGVLKHSSILFNYFKALLLMVYCV